MTMNFGLYKLSFRLNGFVYETKLLHIDLRFMYFYW